MTRMDKFDYAMLLFFGTDVAVLDPSNNEELKIIKFMDFIHHDNASIILSISVNFIK